MRLWWPVWEKSPRSRTVECVQIEIENWEVLGDTAFKPRRTKSTINTGIKDDQPMERRESPYNWMYVCVYVRSA